MIKGGPAWEQYSAAPIGPDNDRHIEDALRFADLVVCAWGTHGAYRGRSAQVLQLMRDCGAVPHALKLTKDGFPSHPLYLRSDLEPFPI